MTPFLKDKSWTDDEKQIVSLLLDGETEFLNYLRRQLSPPFFMWIERRNPNTKPRIYRTPPNEYVIDIVFDGRLQNEFGVGNDISLDIDDLRILEAKLERELTVIGTVNNGILTNIRFVADEPVRWPKYIQLADWRFLSEKESSKKRIAFDKLDVVIRRIQAGELKYSWVKALFVRAGEQGLQIGLWAPADVTAITTLEHKIGARLPIDFREFLNTTDGASISGAKIFGCEEVYLLKANDLSSDDRLLVLATTEAGNLIALDLSRAGNEAQTCPVIFLEHSKHEAVVLSESFKDWLTKFIDIALEEQAAGRHIS